MSDLEAQLRALAKKGELNYISLAPRHDGKKHIGYSATYCPASGFGYGFGQDMDPVVAIQEAIRSWKPLPVPKKEKKKPTTEKVEADPWE